jgi:hypothetical protein
MSIGLLGQKIGMTSIYDAKGKLRPVTVIAAGDNVLLRRLTVENEGYSAVQVGFQVQKESRVNQSLLGEFRKAGVEPKKLMREFRLRKDALEGEITAKVHVPANQIETVEWWDGDHSLASPLDRREATLEYQIIAASTTAPALPAELSAWSPSMPVALLSSPIAPTANVLPSSLRLIE